MIVRPSFSDARRLAAEAGVAHRLAAEQIPLAEATGRTLARDLPAGVDIPHFDSAAMDGWAVTGPGPWVLDSSVAGPLAPGVARAIVTGALVPDGATAVLRSESGEMRGDALLSAVDEPRDGQHIRRAGREARFGEILVTAGTRLSPAHVALAASAGVDELDVAPRPPVTLLLTGDEVVDRGRPAPGLVRDGFGVQLPALIGLLGGTLGASRRVPDDRAATRDALADAPGPLIVTTGGTGDSDADHIRPALRDLGARPLIDGVAMRPGGPTCLAALPDGRLVLALPGNPLAAMVALISLGEPLLATLSGRTPAAESRLPAAPLAGRAGTTLVVPARRYSGLMVPTAWEGSAMMRGLAVADGLLVVPPTGFSEGDIGVVLSLPWN